MSHFHVSRMDIYRAGVPPHTSLRPDRHHITSELHTFKYITGLFREQDMNPVGLRSKYKATHLEVFLHSTIKKLSYHDNAQYTADPPCQIRIETIFPSTETVIYFCTCLCSHLLTLRIPVSITIRNTCIIFNSVFATMVLSPTATYYCCKCRLTVDKANQQYT
jgi:hypothetical protein